MTTTDQTAPAAQPLNARERAFWSAVWLLDGASYAFVALAAYSINKWLGATPVNAAIALIVAGVVFAATRYGLWCLTRPYATERDAVVPAINRADLCNVDFKLMFVGLATIPSGGPSWLSDTTIVYAAAAAACIMAWVALIGPLQAANARDAARNAGVAS
jgi:hypothetical protein